MHLTFDELRQQSKVLPTVISLGVSRTKDLSLKTVSETLTEARMIQTVTGTATLSHLYKKLVTEFGFFIGELDGELTTILLSAESSQAEIIAMGDGLLEARAVSSGGEEGYFDFVFFLSSFMTCMHVENESDFRKMITKSKRMSIVGGYTPIKPMLIAVNTKSAILKGLSFFISRTAELVHCLSLLMNKSKISGDVRQRIKGFAPTYMNIFGHPDRSMRAALELMKNPEMESAMTQTARETGEKISSDPGMMAGLVDFTEDDKAALQSFRKIVAIKNMKPGEELREKFIKKEKQNNPEMVALAQNQSSSGMLGNNGLYNLR